MSERIDPTAIIAALVEGDRWLCADSAAGGTIFAALANRRSRRMPLLGVGVV